MLPDQFDYVTDSAVRGMILAGLETGDNGWVGDLAMRVSTEDAAEDYGWLGTPPALREFIGGRSAKELAEYNFTITNKDYESTLRTPKKSWRRDKTGQLQTRINQLGQRVLDHPAKLLSTLILNGESTACYDGQYFFDTDHSSKNSGTQDNDLGATASTATAPTAAEMSTAIMKAVQGLYALKDDEGEPANQMAKKFGVMVPVPFMGVTLEAITSLLGAGGATNLIPSLAARGMLAFEPIINPRLTWTTKFCVMRLDGQTKPFVLQEEGDMEPIVLGPSSEHAQLNNECIAGVDWSGNVGYGDWTQAALVTFS